MKLAVAAALLGLAVPGVSLAGAYLTPVGAAPPGLSPLATAVGGRALAQPKDGGTRYAYQWPGVYFEAAFKGSHAFFEIGPGDEILHLLVDGQEAARLVRPPAGYYRLDGLTAGEHIVRIEVATESQAGPAVFGGFSLDAEAQPLPAPRRLRQIEFIGDSHTVGYGDLSTKRDCTEHEIWETTDTSVAYGPILARRFGADYQVNAISGHGIVRNYGGFPGDPVPAAHPFVLFDKAQRYDDAAWRPQVIVIALGTNDFSTPLHAGEPWPTRDALRADYEATYVRFVRRLRARDPDALIVLWATDGAEGEIQAEVGKVAAQLRAGGETRLAFVPVNDLQMGACNGHPNLADHAAIADKLMQAIDLVPDAWRGR